MPVEVLTIVGVLVVLVTPKITLCTVKVAVAAVPLPALAVVTTPVLLR